MKINKGDIVRCLEEFMSMNLKNGGEYRVTEVYTNWVTYGKGSTTGILVEGDFGGPYLETRFELIKKATRLEKVLYGLE